MTAVLIDTNILVYAHDTREPKKRQRALRVLERLHELASGRLSVQCLAEVYAAVRRGPKARLTAEEAALQVERLSRAWPVVDLTSMVVLEALRGVRQHKLAYWEAQMWACARLNQIPVLFTEDFQDRQVVEGVLFVNPLADHFDPDAWV